ncbi:alpha/beta fold hydrolase [Brevibacillus choshinensis]|uniref:prolyl aminopeptidase n=1 Tax=Brevibacillus choshinensis TaxID=54911 RepID=A0ABX7FQR9_BRECH|nr:alpha/beta hydrolase [Brevibacillus choshinensis]QRG67642.1 alpha/beta hydrolase [Brevibacillus choshinensis]
MASLKNKRSLILLSILAFLLLLFLFPSWTPEIRDEKGNALPNSVASLEEITLGGIKQSILIRGMDRNNPVVLFLHGGPGYPQIAYARKYQQELEKDFVVVNWDQRGSGKSYHWNMTDEDLKVEKLVEDTAELTKYLQEKFNQPKIFIVGHSWGSLLATWTVQKYPDLFYAYIGVGQVANSPLGEQVSYQFAREEAQKQHNEPAIKELDSIGPPPYKNPRKDATLERKWVTAFGGSERKTHTYQDLIMGVLFAPEYTRLDGVRLAFGDSYSRNAILPQTQHTNLFETVPVWSVPVYLIMGRYDYMTPSAVAYSYYEKVVAPEKHFIWFEESAHFPHFEEEKKFHEVMLGIKKHILPGS